MNKSQLVDAIAKSLQVSTTKFQIDAVLSVAIEQIQNAVANGDTVTLVGFGTFGSSDRKERKGHNPKTGEKITIPACRKPTFKLGKNFKDQVNF